jgi:ribose transport system substrate-binding protein
MISQGADAIIVAPLNSTGLQSVLKKAHAKGIPVVTIDRQTAGTFCKSFITFMGSNFYQQGVRDAKALVKATGGKAKIAEIQGAYGNGVEVARTKGFASIIDKHQGRMKIVAKQTGNWSTTDAQQVLSKILLAHPDINAVYTQSDTMAVGALKALQAERVAVGEQVSIIGFDDLDMASMLNPPLTVIDRPNVEQGAIAARLLLKHFANGDKALERQRLVLPTQLIQRESCKPPRRKALIRSKNTEGAGSHGDGL